MPTKLLAAFLLLAAGGCDGSGANEELLDGTRWDFQRVEKGGQTFQATEGEADMAFTARSLCTPGAACPIDAPFQVSGRGPCNTYFGSYTSDPSRGTLEISDLAPTKMLCSGEGITETEAAFLDVLGNSVRYRVDRPQLQIESADGAIFLTEHR